MSLVLKSLMRHPYKPQKVASDRLHSPFLLGHASAKRVGELHGQSAEVHYLEGWRSLAFAFVLKFVAKTQNPSVPNDTFNGFSVPSFWDFAADNPEELVLCSVRAV